MALNTLEWFKITLLMMLFYSASITIITHAMPDDTLNYVTAFSDLSGNIDLKTVSQTVESSVSEQTSLPVVELGALVFYSGNILIDLLLNFAFAIPQMLSLIMTGILSLIGVSNEIANTVQLFFTVVVGVMYFISIVSLLVGIRSGRLVA